MKRKSERDKKLVDDARFMRWWKAWHREEREAVLAGPHGAVLSKLFRMLENLKRVQPCQLIGLGRSIDSTASDSPTRSVVLHEASVSITRHREKCGLEPIDDALPGEPLRVFQVIRKIITEFPAPAGEPNPATAIPGKQ